MQPGEIIRNLRVKKDLTQKKLAEMAGLKQGYISNIETGRQAPSFELVRKISPILDASKDDIIGMLRAMPAKKGDEIWPAIIAEQHNIEYGGVSAISERRLPENIPKRKLINRVIKILDSGNNKIIKALRSNVDAFLWAVEPKRAEIKEDD